MKADAWMPASLVAQGARPVQAGTRVMLAPWNALDAVDEDDIAFELRVRVCLLEVSGEA